MSDEKYPQIPPGSYTKETLPPLSPGAKKILERVKIEKKVQTLPSNLIHCKRCGDEVVQSEDAKRVAVALGASGVFCKKCKPRFGPW